jgi:hypothetical protein
MSSNMIMITAIDPYVACFWKINSTQAFMHVK